MIGASTHIRHSRRVRYPAMSICQESLQDPIFNYEDKEENWGHGVDINKMIEPFTTSPPVHSILERIKYYKRINETRFELLLCT